jgi:aryl-alcohol dehydrogenase-like predicted oxidoreductase
VSVALLGFTKIEQIHENYKALEVYKNWTQEIEDKISAIINN